MKLKLQFYSKVANQIANTLLYVNHMLALPLAGDWLLVSIAPRFVTNSPDPSLGAWLLRTKKVPESTRVKSRKIYVTKNYKDIIVCYFLPYLNQKVSYLVSQTYNCIGLSQYIDISIYRNTRRIHIASQYEIRIAIYRNFSFLWLNCLFFIQFLCCSNCKARRCIPVTFIPLWKTS